MSETTLQLIHKMNEAKELRSVVRTMKAMSAANLSQYEKAVISLNDYYHSIELGLGLCLRKNNLAPPVIGKQKEKKARPICVVIFGTDQGLVGRFNDDVIAYATKILTALPEKPQIWVVGQRIYSSIKGSLFRPVTAFSTPNTVQGITILASQILRETSAFMSEAGSTELHLIYNHMVTATNYTTARQRLLPFDQSTLIDLENKHWPTKMIPEIIGGDAKVLRALIREYLLILFYRACAESLTSENAIRLAAMQRADKSIKGMLEDLQKDYTYLRQTNIDNELFDLVSGYEALL